VVKAARADEKSLGGRDPGSLREHGELWPQPGSHIPYDRGAIMKERLVAFPGPWSERRLNRYKIAGMMSADGAGVAHELDDTIIRRALGL
jgi:hypothetical protein